MNRSLSFLFFVGFSLLSACKPDGRNPAGAVEEPRGNLAPSAESTSVLLYADGSEAESSCGCGQIIRRVREARDRGVAVREVSPDNPGDVVKRYRLTVAPTVLMLDAKGEAVTRLEGEADATIAALSADLARLEKQVRR